MRVRVPPFPLTTLYAIILNMLLDLAYKSGNRCALLKLGMVKMAAGRTILPAMTQAAEQLGKSVGGKATRGLQTELSAAVPSSVLGEAPLRQYLSLAGHGAPGESATSRWFRGELSKQITPQELAAAATPKVPARASGITEAATVPPPARAPAAEIATVPPPRRRAS